MNRQELFEILRLDPRKVADPVEYWALYATSFYERLFSKIDSTRKVEKVYKRMFKNPKLNKKAQDALTFFYKLRMDELENPDFWEQTKGNIEENMKAKTLLIIALAIAMISICFIGCTTEPVSIESIILSKDIGPDSVPVDPATEFKSGTSIIYISVKVNNMTPEDKLTVEWNYLETGDEINISDFTTEETGSGYIGFNIKVDQGFPTGNYNVLVYLNDELYEALEFSVK